MTTPGHKPGPWKGNYRRVTPVNGKQDGTEDICHVYGDEEKEVANARLIAAAPRMLKALKAFANARFDELDDAYDEALAAIKEAEGNE